MNDIFLNRLNINILSLKGHQKPIGIVFSITISFLTELKIMPSALNIY